MPRDETMTALRWRSTMAAEHRPRTGEAHAPTAPAGVPLHAAITHATAGRRGATSAVLGVVTVRGQDSLTVDVRRGGDGLDGGRPVTYRAAGSVTRVYKGGTRTTLDDIAVGDLVLVHALVAVKSDQDDQTDRDDEGAGATAARIHGLTPSRRDLGA